MTKLDEILAIEEQKWRQKPYDELIENSNESHCYFKEYENQKFQFEIHKNINSRSDKIVIMVECSKDTIIGQFFGKARYFVKSKDNQTRDIEDNEAF